MSSFLKWMVGLGVLFILAIAGFYKSFHPTEHFKEEQVPVLASPHMLSETIKSKKMPVFLQSNLKVKKESFNLLLLGIDARNSERSRTDVMMILNINPIQKKVVVIAIPRDTRVYVENIGYTKINHAHILGESAV
ncbi:LCP family protein [Bacillus taeanensis]|uniref:Cell envelope-related transcriptional attenuator domain-containing protein n=1 Tax=Bacillus taeanensis TaxID=273032 RepID=A0A366XQM5_9BACI|nr:LCP family protein [Bacillus taeanensis]RBW68016.1 hypothetical protein DS031_18945 [Bacillus taeanensis]